MPAADLSVVAVLERFADEGWTADHTARPDGIMECGRCRRQTPAHELTVDALHRVEGASDPDDMQMVIGVACPNCGASGALVVSYGPIASERDAALVADLDLDDASDPIAVDPRTDVDGRVR